MKEPFKIRAKSFIIKRCNSRLFLLKGNISGNKSNVFRTDVEDLLNKVRMLTSDAEIAALLIKNEALLKVIIPGKKHACHEAMMNELDVLCFEATQFYKPIVNPVL